jgi:hypothetical protein
VTLSKLFIPFQMEDTSVNNMSSFIVIVVFISTYLCVFLVKWFHSVVDWFWKELPASCCGSTSKYLGLSLWKADSHPSFKYLMHMSSAKWVHRLEEAGCFPKKRFHSTLVVRCNENTTDVNYGSRPVYIRPVWIASWPVLSLLRFEIVSSLC